ncbi:LexA repressor [gamma proteobacterium HTCC5015]|nr:LexA repressor [gamma proteobacterium HTCC5015]
MLSKREQAVYEFICQFILEQGQAPLLSEIGEGLGINSKGVVHRYLSALEEQGYIERSKRHRGIRVLDEQVSPGTLPLMGRIAAGQPIEAVNDQQQLDLNSLFAGSNRYALQVKGDSMVEAGICDGDWVVIESAQTARNGDIVVALVDDEDATLKTIDYRAGGQVALIPSNSAMEAMVYPEERVQIQGILKGQLRVY